MDKITIFYNKRSGIIKEACSGEQNMSYFGVEQEDYEKIFDFLIVEYDEFVFKNLGSLEVIEGRLKLITQSVPTQYL